MDQTLKDWLQAASWAAAIVVGVVGIVKVVVELRASRSQRENDLRWKMVQAAKTLNDEMLESAKAQSAMLMLDWENRSFEIAPGVTATVTRADKNHALRTKTPPFTLTEVYVRDCFDSFFYYLSIFEHYTTRRLILFEDIRFPIEYYVRKLTEDRAVYENYMREYRFSHADEFLKRFEEWTPGLHAQKITAAALSHPHNPR